MVKKKGQGVGEETRANTALTSLYRRGTQYISDVTNQNCNSRREAKADFASMLGKHFIELKIT
jgi:hypothetical protein